MLIWDTKVKRIYFEEQQLEDTLDYLNYVSDNIKVKSEIDYKITIRKIMKKIYLKY